MRVAELGAVRAPLSLAERPTPEPGPGEILVKVTACGMCYSEVNLLNGEYPFARFPVIPGHEITGVVAALGPDVEWPAVGTAVGAQFLASPPTEPCCCSGTAPSRSACRRCRWCLADST
jgi:alcohol dehydrogenase, propanol-preferring